MKEIGKAKAFRLDEVLERRLTEWRRRQTPIPTFSEAVRQLLTAQLEQEKKSRRAA